jgi:tRNA threonylcarbamoyladenosine modification (KEOPS) complex  Pcc1 subunit
MRAEIEIECAKPDEVIEVLSPEMDESARFNARLEPIRKSIKMTIEAKDIAGLLAGTNSYLRLIKTAIDVQEVE